MKPFLAFFRFVSFALPKYVLVDGWACRSMIVASLWTEVLSAAWDWPREL